MDEFGREALRADLVRDEGERLKPYRDTVGKLTLGVGRNLDDVGISHDEAMMLLDNDITRAAAGLDKALPWWRTLDATRQRAVLNLAFNMGLATLLTFKNTLAALKDRRYDAAAAGILDSKYATQVGARARRVAEMIRTGDDA